MNNKPKIMLSVILLFVLFGVVYGFYDMASIINSAESDDGITCEDGQYEFIMPDGTHGGCAPDPASLAKYQNGTEITNLGRKSGYGNVFILNDEINVVYAQIIFRPILNDTMQPRYFVDGVSEKRCEGDVYIGEADCVTWVRETYNIYINMTTMNQIDKI